ncbi:hypothetical protein ADIAL_1309 [Alkalibacterium sp. AK22]|uniref:DUF2507 domain-containing protein n=1 Tax=Alkalibacterium sp. AK22 TaxID=1229520 RepID=UPI000445FB88|nr:DUF2507 domain-containing protein [Alkalibacterium sp. AK22]EXJ23162.1 hypothetical protein ADIAL_1309 [Alkalibacterium sp. AK22]
MTDESNQDVLFDGLALIRDTLLPNLLKEDQSAILYWAGKELARDFAFSDFQELAQAVKRLSFGTIELKEHKKTAYRIHLTGAAIESRLKRNQKADFSLEAGFLAEAIQQLSGYYSEGSWQTSTSQQHVDIRIESDPKEKITEQTY